jgi:hypothetical protein
VIGARPVRRPRGIDAPFVYGRVANLYDAWMRMAGFARGVEQFLDRMDWRLPARPRIVDAGAGTGIMGLWCLRRFPESEVVAFDIDRRMLGVLSRTARRRLGAERRRLLVAHGDLRAPAVVTRLDTGQAVALAAQTFDAVLVGAAREHVPLDASVEALARLRRPPEPRRATRPAGRGARAPLSLPPVRNRRGACGAPAPRFPRCPGAPTRAGRLPRQPHPHRGHRAQAVIAPRTERNRRVTGSS